MYARPVAQRLLHCGSPGDVIARVARADLDQEQFVEPCSYFFLSLRDVLRCISGSQYP